MLAFKRVHSSAQEDEGGRPRHAPRLRQHLRWRPWALAGLVGGVPIVCLLLVGFFVLAVSILSNPSDNSSIMSEANVFHAKGVEAYNRGHYREALSHFQQALVIIREVGDRAGEGATLNNIGIVYKSQGLYEPALENYVQALVIFREVDDQAGEGATLNNIGVVYERQGLVEQALESYNKALVIARDTGNKPLEESILNNIKDIHHQEARNHLNLSKSWS